MNFQTMIIVSTLTVVLCAGCNVWTNDNTQVETNPAENPVDEATDRGMRGYMQEFKLKDGTRCITWKSGSGGGLSCDWRGEK